MTKPLSIALAQINPTVGDIAGNAAKILAFYEQAKAKGAGLVIFPELSLIGYPPEDLVLMLEFQQRAMDTVRRLAVETNNGPAMLFGSIFEENGKLFNAALLITNGKISNVKYKQSLPNYGIFDEKRIFSTGIDSHVVNCSGINLGILICEDVWSGKQTSDLKRQGAELIVVINASPFEAGKLAQRKAVAQQAVNESRLPLVYVNMVGGQDDIVFDGGSFVMNAKGEVVLQMPEFEEALDIFIPGKDPSIALRAVQDDNERLWKAMCLGLSDYVRKNNFPGVLLGLSGGIDSAITAAVAVDALGADKVKGVLLPSPYSSQDSTDDALETATLLGIETMTVPITEAMQTFDHTLSPVFGQDGWMTDISVGGNLQARLRGVTLMALSNKLGFMLLSTGNKSEIAVGYTTLYGDSCGGYNVLKDVYKTQVYALAKWRNAKNRVIPERSITKAPTAELAPGQKDQDQLPPYDMLDQILTHHIEGRLGVEEIVSKGFNLSIVEKVLKLVRMNEYKRRQSCPGVKLSPMLFGRDRRYPLTNKF